MVRCPECEQWVSVDVVGDVAMFSWHNSAAGDLHYSFCSASGQSVTRNALHAFGEVIATIARAALICDAARGNSVEALHEPNVGTMRRTTATYWRDAGGWSVVTVERGAGLPITRNRVAIVGTPEDTAALVVDAVLREFDRWSNEP